MIADKWDYVKKRKRYKISNLQSKFPTDIGKSTLVKIVLTAIESLTGTILELPDKTEKQLTSIAFEFYVGKSEKETTRPLATQLKGRGDLSITLFRSKLDAHKESYKEF